MPVTQVARRQLQDGIITDTQVAAGAGIATSKLADGVNFINRNGSVAMTGALPMGTQKITNLGTPTASADAATKAYVDGAVSGINSIFDSKGSARAATTANVTISNPGTAVFDSITLSLDNTLFVRAQTSAQENGLYLFKGSGAALVRVLEMDAWDEFPGAFFAVEEGTIHADTVWLCTVNAGGTVNTTPVTFQQIPTSAGLLSTNFVDKEAPSGSIDGSNVTFTLANTPTSGSEHVYLNGLLQEVGSGNDYTISGGTITMLTAPITGDKIRASYRK